MDALFWQTLADADPERGPRCGVCWSPGRVFAGHGGCNPGNWHFLLGFLLFFGAGGCALRNDSSAEGRAVGVPLSLQGPRFFDPPSHDRMWKLEQSLLPYAEMGREEVTIRNVRECRWRTDEEKDVAHQTWSFTWDDVQGVDWVVVPFQKLPALAHTMLSFRLRDGRVLTLSVEARQERHERYQPLAGTVRQYELMYVWGNEDDLLGLRGAIRGDDVFLYPSPVSAAAAAELLRETLERTNQLAARPEYYDSLTNSCSTNLLVHAQRSLGDEVAADWRRRLPGNGIDRFLYQLGLLGSERTFEEARREAWVSGRIREAFGTPDFSNKIRRRV